MPRFRWRFVDDTIGEQWSKWHALSGPCSACCCGGPDEGEHTEAAGYYDEDGFIGDYGHARLDPADLYEWDVVEYAD